MSFRHIVSGRGTACDCGHGGCGGRMVREDGGQNNRMKRQKMVLGSGWKTVLVCL